MTGYTVRTSLAHLGHSVLHNRHDPFDLRLTAALGDLFNETMRVVAALYICAPFGGGSDPFLLSTSTTNNNHG